MTESVEITHDAAANRFTTEVDGERAALDYTIAGDVMTITHTHVPRPIERRGIAGELMSAALRAARDRGWRVVPECSYAAAYMAKHPQELVCDLARQHESELLDEALEESFPASDSPAVGRST